MDNRATFKDYLAELTMDVDLSNPNDAVMKIKKAARMGNDRAAIMNVKQSQEDMKDARAADPGDPTRQLDMKIATLTSQLAQLQKRKAQMMKNTGGEM